MNWRSIEGFDGHYEVSDTGLVRSVDRYVGNRIYPGRVLAAKTTRGGYKAVHLRKPGISCMRDIHRLVASAFIPNNDLFATTVNHKNEDKTDNRVENLEWMSQADNNRYSDVLHSGRTRKKILCTTTGDTFESIKDASNRYGLRYSSVTDALHRGTSLFGYRFEYLQRNAF